MTTCPFCSSNVDADSTFCPQCGRNISVVSSPVSRPGRRWIVSGVAVAVIVLTGAVGLWASQGGNAGWISAKLGLSKPAGAFPASASTGGCCAPGSSGGGCGMAASGAGCGGGGCGSTSGNISDEEAYQAATSVFSFWASRYSENDLKVEVLNKGCHAEIYVFLKDAPLKSYKYMNGNIADI